MNVDAVLCAAVAGLHRGQIDFGGKKEYEIAYWAGAQLRDYLDEQVMQ